MYGWNSRVSDARLFNGEYGNALFFGGVLAANFPYTLVLKPEEAWNIDTKLDDGRPATGKVSALVPTTLATCTNTADTSNMAAVYLLTSTSPGCVLIFRNSL